MNEYTYNFHKPGRFIDRLATRKREKMFDLYLEEFPAEATESVLDVGVTADSGALSSNYFERLFPDKSKIIALSDQDASNLEKEYPGLEFKIGDARALPFPDNSIDVVTASAVIEHVGSYEKQKKMLEESMRVAKKGIFITTPNRWHPIDAHTVTPLLHWLPKNLHRKVLGFLGMKFFSKEENLNLLDEAELTQMCREIGINKFHFRKISTLGITSNLLLVAKK